MPELPEVTTTVAGINEVLKGLVFTDVWSDWPKMIKSHTFLTFKKEIVGEKFLKAERRAKNILIHLSNNKTIAIHMKMTGHIMYGRYHKHNNSWRPHQDEKNLALRDPYNRFLHVVFTLSSGKHLVFCDTRKFGTVKLYSTHNLHEQKPFSKLGPEPLEKNFTFAVFKKQIQKRPRGFIKTVLMDQNLISGIGNIYSDEILFVAGVNPEERVEDLPEKFLKEIFQAIKPTLRKGISFGGDSTSDYRNIHGERGKFQGKHQAYRRTGQSCGKRGCSGIITRKVVNGRSAHFCSKHQAKIHSKK